jgi:hypothetical protein
MERRAAIFRWSYSFGSSKEARSDYRSIQNNTIIPKWGHGAWNCYQQIHGKLHVCFSTLISPPKESSFNC